MVWADIFWQPKLVPPDRKHCDSLLVCPYQKWSCEVIRVSSTQWKRHLKCQRMVVDCIDSFGSRQRSCFKLELYPKFPECCVGFPYFILNLKCRLVTIGLPCVLCASQFQTAIWPGSTALLSSCLHTCAQTGNGRNLTGDKAWEGQGWTVWCSGMVSISRHVILTNSYVTTAVYLISRLQLP